MADEVRTAQPKEFYRKYLEQGVRPDNRELGEFRPTVLDIGSKNGSCISTAEGSALIRLGNTIVICGIKGELAEPKTETPTEGYLVPNVELSAVCSPQFRPGPPSEQAQVLSQFVANVLKNSQCVELEDLCIAPGKMVWVLYADLICLDYDGNVADACVLALTAALSNTSLPVVRVDEETGKTETDFKEEKKIQLTCTPISATSAIFEDNVLLVDPTRQEEELSTGLVTVVTDGKNICSLEKPGGSPLKDQQMRLCIERAFQRHTEACNLITQSQGSTLSTLTSPLVDR
ncbi:exosome complex component RRP43-like [Littorina saxatilis]|uniref:Ribosomal RNA-processing protein 43 n=1 Tax=Littorina saxatilis TaxID=31220 RepID=A0AAN9G7C3_9CAEN